MSNAYTAVVLHPCPFRSLQFVVKKEAWSAPCLQTFCALIVVLPLPWGGAIDNEFLLKGSQLVFFAVRGCCFGTAVPGGYGEGFFWYPCPALLCNRPGELPMR